MPQWLTPDGQGTPGVPDLIAIDIAILPPRDVSAAAVTFSAGLPRTESQGLVLDATHLPHITLTQQFVPHAELPAIGDAIATVVAATPSFPLRVTGPGRSNGTVWMQVTRTVELHDLHRALMHALLPFERRGGTPAAFFGGDARQKDVAWVSGFRGGSSDARFTPHITLGHASRLPEVAPIAFHADTIALCHLGRFCTCRHVLQSWSLRAR
jgi:2'-5' RNA ligase